MNNVIVYTRRAIAHEVGSLDVNYLSLPELAKYQGRLIYFRLLFLSI
jgi:hypothetical protein